MKKGVKNVRNDMNHVTGGTKDMRESMHNMIRKSTNNMMEDTKNEREGTTNVREDIKKCETMYE